MPVIANRKRSKTFEQVEVTMANGRIHFSKEDIGGEILPILTTGLYRDTLDALREYIQNSIDADAKQIDLFVDPDTVSVTDDGRGMDRSEARKAMRLGISEKNPLLNPTAPLPKEP